MIDLVAFATLALAGIGVMGYAAYLVWAGLRARTWPTVPGEIARHRIETHWTADDGREYQAITAFRYRVGDQPYVSERVRFDAPFLSPNATAALRAAEHAHPAGAKVVVHVNPHDPTDAVLQPGIAPSALVLALVGLIVLAMGVAGFRGAAG